ncbi:pickpocket protein 28 [Ceratitis capitata]|uniref:pickpocket protein 28 n=1 Tax=Ceratitis capitata TaxID=7213 RepID=UPI000A11FEFE|nr:pickpocket protein 28 [Ceratitis capitata]
MNNSIRSNKKRQKNTKCKVFFQVVCGYVTQFLSQTTLQGLIYVGNAQLSLWERAYFLIWFITVITVAINFATNVYIRWETTPVIIALEAHTTQIRTTPFPAITICNMNQAIRSQTEHFPNHSLGYAMIQKICFQDVDFSQFDDLKPASREDTFTNFIWRNGQSCDNMIVYCRFGNKEDRCTDFYREVLMDEGICCAFNILHPSYLYKGKYIFVRDFTSSIGTIPVDWNLETGYADKLPLYFYPRTAARAGVISGFTFVLNANISEYICSSTFSTGLKVITHNPIDTPHVKETGLSVQPGYQHRFRLNIDSSKALPSTRSIAPKRRQCLFNNELQLLYFRYYTRRNCEMECDSKYFLRRCQCIPYHMPLIYPNVSVCDVKDFNCESIAEAKVNDRERIGCKRECLPGCFNLEYFPTVYRTPLGNTSFVFRDRFFRNFTRKHILENFALVQIYFADDLFRSKVRSPYTSFTDYLSQTGGIMSLMVGFGVISVPEFFYFFFIRPIFDLVMRRMSCAVRRVTVGQFRKVAAGGNGMILGNKQIFYAGRPLVSRRRPLNSINAYKSQKIYNSLLRKLSVPKIQTLNIDTENEGLFPYIE